MFASSAFQGDISQWNVQKVKNFTFMFEFATQFDCDLSGWKTQAAEDMGWMFRGAINFNSPLPLFRVFGVTGMVNMFAGATNFSQDLCSWDVDSFTVDTRGIFAATSCPVSLESISSGGAWCYACT